MAAPLCYSIEVLSLAVYAYLKIEEGLNMVNTDTNAAIATAMGNSGIGIVRISGDEAVEIADRLFK